MKYILLIIIITSTLLFGCTTTQTENNYVDFTVLDALQTIHLEQHNPDFKIIDMRTKEEYDNGHIQFAKNIDYYKADFKEELTKLDKNSSYLIYCKSGERTKHAIEIMKTLEFRNVYHMQDGLLKWKEKGYPIEISLSKDEIQLEINNMTVPLPKAAINAPELSNSDYSFELEYDYTTVKEYYVEELNIFFVEKDEKLVSKYEQEGHTIEIIVSRHPTCEVKTLLEFNIEK